MDELMWLDAENIDVEHIYNVANNMIKRADRSQLIECDRLKEEALERAQEAEERAKEAEARAARAESESERLRAEVDARERLLSSLSPSRSTRK